MKWQRIVSCQCCNLGTCRKNPAVFELIDILSCEEKKKGKVSLGHVEEKGKSERKRNSSLLGEVKAVQPNTSSPPHSQPGVAKATLTLFANLTASRLRGERAVCNCIISALHGVCVRACLHTWSRVRVCICDQVCECVPLVSRLSVYSGFVVCVCVLLCVLLHKQACCITGSYLRSVVTRGGNLWES